MHILQDIVIILLSAIVIIVISGKLKIPSVVGFLLTGLAIGPYTTGLIKNTHDIEILAEIGVVLMMFIIGIEFSIKKLNRIKKLIAVGGGGQVILTITAVTAISVLLEFSFATAIFFGFLVSLSSTAIVLKLLQERRQIDSPQGKIELGILLFQDLCVVPIVILIPILALRGDMDIYTVLTRVAIAFIAINVIFFTARKMMPYLLNVIVKTRLKEIFIIASLFLCLGMAFLTNSMGLSLALGAFIAGLIISESRYSHQVIADILPFKETFYSVFFISIGMLMDLSYVLQNIPMVLSLGLGIFLLKSLIIYVLVAALKYPIRVAVISAMGLAQVGEFSFILAKLGLQYELISNEIFQAFLSSSILTMIFTPFAFKLSPRAARRFEEGRMFRPLARLAAKEGVADSGEEKLLLENHVIIVGYGLNGKNLARVLKKRRIRYSIIELNPDTVTEAAERGENVVYGDATREGILTEAGIKTAKVITFAISDPLVIDRAVAIARDLNPTIYIIARTKYVSEIDRLYELGADMVFAEEYETSIEILARVMMSYGFSKESISREINELHKQRYAEIRNKREERKLTDRIHSVIHEEISIDSFTISRKCSAESKSIAELDIRAKTGATIISVVRDKEHFSNPAADLKLKEGDVIILMGTHEQVEQAVGYLS
ncbi:MAG: cation:proton antiporter [Chlorobi bacterium]|nr:cation:proton antiporter [Chlorobiota bacterium]